MPLTRYRVGREGDILDVGPIYILTYGYWFSENLGTPSALHLRYLNTLRYEYHLPVCR